MGPDQKKRAMLPSTVISVFDLLCDRSLRIPIYQRPYRWTTRNVQQIFTDVAHHRGGQYRLGTIVFHRDGEEKNIVDGQQRTVTLLLAVRALIAHQRDAIADPQLRQDLDRLADTVNPSFTSEISKANIRANYQEICRIVQRDFDEDAIRFLLHGCHVVTFTLDDVSEAFQFFDSQNARGKDLDPHDLLKAYHLREFVEPDAAAKSSTVADWETANDQELATLFAAFWSRVRNWCRGASARHFDKEHTFLFKGVNLARSRRYPHLQSLRITHEAVDDAGQSFPYQLDQVILNGRRFFEMTGWYLRRVGEIPGRAEGMVIGGLAGRILHAVNNYPGRNRTGDRYVRMLFDCLLLYYIDKFGLDQIELAIEKIFAWAYRLRLEMQSLQLASMDNHVLENNQFRWLRDAVQPADFLAMTFAPIRSVRSSKTGPIEALFREGGYLA